MSYNRKATFQEQVIAPVQQLATKAVELVASQEKALAKLASLKAYRVDMYDSDQLVEPQEDRQYLAGAVTDNAKMAATYFTAEDVVESWVDEAE
ncbi:hypothetical protein KAR91_06280, partial [Candidatus Pacearchaeota archaeon]|nr:hypothetical protein [Candidatus Pacearchaeota archaeon]